MNDLEIRANAIGHELAMQRSMLGDRAANLAADNAELRAENAALKKRVADLEKPTGPAR